MRLITLGDLRLTGGNFSNPQPLLILTYLALEGRRSRGELKELFWAHQPDTTKRSKSLSDALRRLKQISPHLVEPGRDWLLSYVSADVHAFRAAVKARRYEEADALYGGPFLQGLERKRLQLGEEVEAWIEQERKALQRHYLQVLLALAEERSRQGDKAAAKDYVMQASTLPQAVGLPATRDLTRMHTLLVRLGCEAEAEQVAGEFHEALPSAGQRAATQTDAPPLFGRESELADLEQRFDVGARLVSLTGLAGVGKTALAQTFARQASPLFEDVYVISLVSLARNTTPTVLWRLLSDALNMRVSDAHLADTVSEQLEDSSVLLVLDNFEPHMTLRSVVAHLLRDCPRLRVLVTSRERLGLAEEQVIALKGLDVPEPEAHLLDLQRTGAGQLLLAEARKQGITFQVEHARDLSALCRQMVGLPLALKLAAGWLSSLPLRDLVERSRSSLSLLRTDEGTFTNASSMSAAFDFSVTLLSDEARLLFSKLGIFVGGFDLEAAEVVSGARPSTLKRLVDASLLTFDGCRYSVHPLVAQYMAEQYPVADALKARHVNHYLTALKSTAGSSARAKEQAAAHLRHDLANLSLAWDGSVAQAHWVELSTCLSALRRFYDLLARPQDGLERIDTALTPSTPAAFATELRAYRAWFLLRLGRYGEAVRDATLASSQLPLVGEAHKVCFNTLGAAHDSLGEFTAARHAFASMLQRAAPNSRDVALGQANLAINAINRGDYAAAQCNLTEAKAGFAAQKDQANLVWCAYISGWLFLETGNLLRARVTLEQALTDAQELNLTHWISLIEIKQVSLFALSGYSDHALQRGRQILEEIRRHNLVNREVRVLTVLGGIYQQAGDCNAALRCFSSSLKRAQQTQSRPIMLRNLVGVLRSLEGLGLVSIYDPLHTYCANRASQMFYVDRQTFRALVKHAENTAWQQLEVSEVASLTRSLLDEEGTLTRPLDLT